MQVNYVSGRVLVIGSVDNRIDAHLHPPPAAAKRGQTSGEEYGFHDSRAAGLLGCAYNHSTNPTIFPVMQGMQGFKKVAQALEISVKHS